MVADILPYEVPSTFEVKNARIDYLTVGSLAHDGRAFFSVGLSGESWGQSFCPLWDLKTVDRLIDVCGAADLFQCRRKLVRVYWREEMGSVSAIGHIVDSKPLLILRPEDFGEVHGG